MTPTIVRPGHRSQGLTYPLVAGAVGNARAQGASSIEGYPFLAAGFPEVSRPTVRRVVMRLEL